MLFQRLLGRISALTLHTPVVKLKKNIIAAAQQWVPGICREEDDKMERIIQEDLSAELSGPQ